MNAANDIMLEMKRALESQGMEVERYYPECGPGQYEMTLKPAPALTAADNQVLFRETARGIVQKRGLIASFMPKPFTDVAGSGVHLHVSL